MGGVYPVFLRSSEFDYTSSDTQYLFDMNTSYLFVKDQQNFINIVGKKQLNTIANASLLDIFMSNNNMVELHYHPNASELVYGISGVVTVP